MLPGQRHPHHPWSRASDRPPIANAPDWPRNAPPEFLFRPCVTFLRPAPSSARRTASGRCDRRQEQEVDMNRTKILAVALMLFAGAPGAVAQNVENGSSAMVRVRYIVN